MNHGLLVLKLLLVGGLLGFAVRYPQQTVESPEIKHPKADFSAAIWAYHFGFDNRGWYSLNKTANLFKAAGTPRLK